MIVGNPLLEILVVSILATVVSVLRELYEGVRVVKELPSIAKYCATIFLRWIHYILIVFPVGFFAFFRGEGPWYSLSKKFWMRVELAILFFIVFGWYIFECCSLSYLEMMFYDVKVSSFSSGVNPTFHSLFYPFGTQVKAFFAIMYLVNILTIFFTKPTVMPLLWKAIYFIAFLYFYIRCGVLPAVVKSWARNYPKNNIGINLFQGVYDKYLKNI